MKRIHYFSPYAPRQYPARTRLRTALRAALLLGLLGLAAQLARAQNVNTGTAYNTGSTYEGAAFTNAAGASYTNTGSGTRYYAGPAAGTFTNNGTYAGSSAATDQFIGPGGSAGTQELAGSTAPAFYNLTLANGPSAAFTVSNPAGADIANSLTLSNGITTTVDNVAGALRLGTGAAAVGTFSTARYVDGYVGKAGTSSFSYPLGDINQSGGNTTAVGAAIYSPITLSNPGGTALRYTAATTPGYTSFATQSAPLQLKSVSSREYYPVSVGTVPSGSTITLPYGNFGPTAVGGAYVGDPASLTIAAYDGTRWLNLSATAANSVNTGAKTVTVTLPAALATGYSALALASTSTQNPLPVVLVSFTAQKQGTDGLLRWRTASELNSDYFELQASRNGSSWQPLTRVAAAGSSSSARDYQYLDPVLARYGVPVIYYRLRQVDRDAKEYYSPVVTLSPDAATWQLTAYPNPYAGDLTAQLTTPEAGPVTLLMLDAAGREVLRRQVAGQPGSQVFELDAAHTFASGAYTLLVRQGSHTGTVRVVRE